MLSYSEYDRSSKVHLYFVRKRKPKGRKTPIYSVRKHFENFRMGAVELGEIRWCGAFRQFSLYPADGSAWSKGCLEIVNRFLKKINDRHRRKLRRKS